MPKQMNAECLGEILDVMPRPFSVRLRLFGEYDHSGLAEQVSEFVPGITLLGNADSDYTIRGPTREQIMLLYELTAKDYPTADLVMADFSDVVSKYPELSTAERMRRMRSESATLLNANIPEKGVFLDDIIWYMKGVRVTLTPALVLIEHEYKRPQGLSPLKKILKEYGINVTMEQKRPLISRESR